MANVWLLTEEQKNIDMYLQAAANLYGFIPPRQFLLIYNRYSKNVMPKLLKDNMMKYSNKLNRQAKNYRIYEDAIINTTAGKEVIYKVMYGQTGKKFYVPEREEFLKWVDGRYCPPTPQCNALCNYLMTVFKSSPGAVQAAIPEVFHSVLIGERMQAQVDIFEKHGIVANNVEEIVGFQEYFVEFLNNSRRWDNCGHTPVELSGN